VVAAKQPKGKKSKVRNLPGLSPVWLITLAAILAYLVGLAGEAFQRGLYEALRDFQPSIIGALALGTAIWAAKPVFGQLQAARRQAAVVAYEALAETEASLTAESLLIDDVDQEIFSVNFTHEDIDIAISVANGPQWDPNTWSTELDKRRKNLLSLRKNFRSMKRRPWGSAEIQNSRQILDGEIARYAMRIRSLAYRLKAADSQFSAGVWHWPDVTKSVQEAMERASSSSLEEKILAYSIEILSERQRVQSLIAQSYGEFAPDTP
jgi:hypothetical protein